MKFKKESKSPFYTLTKWRKLRAKILKRNPLCVECKERKAVHVDHIRPVRLYPELKYVEFNLRALCIGCHSRKTIADKMQRPPKPPPRGANEEGLPTDPTHSWNKEEKNE